jgi:exodeoxyribonuclease-1
LNELSRETITISLRPNIVPSPRAFLTHCLTPQELELGISEYKAARKIHRLFNTPGTISCGYNSLGFDDEFLRFLFYRNLLDPYSHQFSNGCARMDMLPITVLFKLFCNHVLSWPELSDGRPTMKLEYLSEANCFEVSGRAHEAMADVEALLALARVFSGQKQIWEYVLGFFNKTEDVKRQNRLGRHITVGPNRFDLGLMVSVSFGAKVNYIAPVVRLGGSVPYRNQDLWLRMDTDGLFDKLDDENNIYDFFVIRKRPGDQLILLPCLERFWKRLAPDALANYEKNVEAVDSDAERFLKTAAFHKAFAYPDIPDVDPDAALYKSGFFSPKEKSEISRFHKFVADEKYEVCDSIESDRIRTLALRILLRNFQCDGVKSSEFAAHISRLAGAKSEKRVIGYKNDVKFTCSQAVAELEQIESMGIDDLEPVQKEITAWLKVYINKLSTSFADSF